MPTSDQPVLPGNVTRSKTLREMHQLRRSKKTFPANLKSLEHGCINGAFPSRIHETYESSNLWPHHSSWNDHIGMPVDGRMDALEPEAASTCSSSNPPRPCKISKAHNMASNFPTPTFFLDSFFCKMKFQSQKLAMAKKLTASDILVATLYTPGVWSSKSGHRSSVQVELKS